MHTKYFIDLIMGNLFGSKVNPAIPGKYYIGLSTATPSVDGTGVKEPSASGSGYSRIPVDSFTVPSDGIVKNNSNVEFQESTSSWGVVTHYVVFDSSTGGNLLFYGELTSPRTIEANSIVILKQNEIQLSLTNK